MEKIVLENPNSFKLEDIFECGQCFRWNKNEEGSYIGVVGHNVICCTKKDNIVTITCNSERGLSDIVHNYFDFDTDYEMIKSKLSLVDMYLKEATQFGSGIRILKQDLWETIISFIISANNNIPRIKKIINNMSKEYGEKISFDGEDYYTFPSIQSLSKASVEDLRKLGLGFRDKRIYNTTRMIRDGEVSLDRITQMSSTEDMREELLKLDGVGPKVADCILLFALHRFDVFPIDVWVRRVMNDLYIHSEDENKVSKKEIMNIANEKFGSIKGLAQQYLFYWKREEN